MSSGALEILSAQGRLCGVQRMPKFLGECRKAGWIVAGAMALPAAASSAPTDAAGAYSVDAPVVLVMGNEANGLRTNIVRECTHVASVPVQSGALNLQCCARWVLQATTCARFAGMVELGLDSLNVSVAAGILMATLSPAAAGSEHMLSHNPRFKTMFP